MPLKFDWIPTSQTHVTDMHTFLRTLILALSALAIGPLSHGQNAKMTLKFLSFPMQTEKEPIELAISAKETLQIDTPSHRLSDPYVIAAVPQIIVGKTVVGPDGKSKFNIYGMAKSLPAKEQIVLLFRKGQKMSDGVTVLPVRAQDEDFPGGSMFFINASGTPCRGHVGDKKFLLRPGERKVITPKADFNGDTCQVSLSYFREQAEESKRWKLFRDTRWSVDKDLRTLAFFYQHPQTGKVSIAPVMEMLGADPPPAPPE